MRCHYEVFELPREASAEDIKRQYKKLALKWHPDKNVGNEEEATDRFKEVNAAYAVLSDPNERKWYDDHRESIIKGDDFSDESYGEAINLWRYFSSSCYSGTDDSETGFYFVYNQVFESIHKAEISAGCKADFSPFGTSQSLPEEVVAFYYNWEVFSSKLSFSWEDKYNPAEAPNRDVRRAIDKENKKSRDKAKKTYIDTVRALISYVKKRDKRIIAISVANEAEKRQKQKLYEQKKAEDSLKKKEAKKVKLQQLAEDEDEYVRREEERKKAFLLAEEDSEEDRDGGEDDLDDSELEQQIEAMAGLNVGRSYTAEELQDSDGEEEEEGEGGSNSTNVKTVEIFKCVTCSKDFKSQSQLSQHLASKNHRKKEQELQKKNKLANKNPKSIFVQDSKV